MTQRSPGKGVVMITSAHVAKIGARGALFRGLKPASVPGLLSADGGLTARLSPSLIGAPDPTRVAMVAFWEDEASLDQFLLSHPTGRRLADGWQARLEPVRAYGDWPGLPEDIRRTRTAETEGPVIVTTLGKLKMSQLYRFLKTSAVAEGRVVQSPGMVWATGIAGLPFVGTISIWESAQAVVDYAYGEAQPEHGTAIGADRAKTFHHQKAFIRYRPLSVSGGLTEGRNPIPPFALPTE